MSLNFPARVTDLRELEHDDHRMLYRHEGDGFVLCRVPLALYEKHLSDMALLAEHAATMAKIEAAHAAFVTAATRMICATAARRALLDAGARLDLIDGAAALFGEQTKLALTPDGGVVVDEPGTIATVDFAATAWLDGPAGAPYRAERPAKGVDGFFARQLRLVGTRQ